MSFDSQMPPPSSKKNSILRKGVFKASSVRFASFIVIALGLFATALLCVLAIWDYTTRDAAWRAMSTFGVVAGTMLAFTFFNEVLGSRIDA